MAPSLLVDAVITAARGTFDTLRLRTENPTAARLYARMRGWFAEAIAASRPTTVRMAWS